TRCLSDWSSDVCSSDLGPIEIQPGGYGGFCGGIVRSGVSLLRADGTGWTVPNLNVVLPVDVAYAAGASQLTVIGAGSTDVSGFRTGPALVNVAPPVAGTPTHPEACGGSPIPPPEVQPRGQVVSVAFGA